MIAHTRNPPARPLLVAGLLALAASACSGADAVGSSQSGPAGSGGSSAGGGKSMGGSTAGGTSLGGGVVMFPRFALELPSEQPANISAATSEAVSVFRVRAFIGSVSFF